MALFAVIPQPGANGERLAPAIANAFDAGAVRRLGGDKGWLIVARGDPEHISRMIGIHDGSNGAGIVFQVATYSGRADSNIWAWINGSWGILDA